MALHDEQDYLLKISGSLAETDPILAAEINNVYHTHARVNQIHLAQLRAIMQMPGFSGLTERGVRAGGLNGMLPAEDTTRTLDDFSDSASLEAEEDGARHDAVEDELSDNAQDELVWMGQFVEDLAVAPYDNEDVPHSRHGVLLFMMDTFRI